MTDEIQSAVDVFADITVGLDQLCTLVQAQCKALAVPDFDAMERLFQDRVAVLNEVITLRGMLDRIVANQIGICETEAYRVAENTARIAAERFLTEDGMMQAEFHKETQDRLFRLVDLQRLRNAQVRYRQNDTVNYLVARIFPGDARWIDDRT